MGILENMHMKRFKIPVAVLLVMTLLTAGMAVRAADQTARLKNSLQEDIMYTVSAPETLENAWNAGTSGFKAQYNGKHVVLSGEIRSGSVTSGSKQVTLYGTGTGSVRKVTVDMSGQSEVTVANLKAGDTLTVYGQISVSWLLSKSFSITAEHAEVNSGRQFTATSAYFWPDTVYDGTELNDMASDGHVILKVPADWVDDYVCSRLTNNGINGYQFSLNAISPAHTDYPEIFYIFYFDNETYLEEPPSNPTEGDNEDIEEAIIRNILENLDDDFKIKVSQITTANGRELHYSSETYRPADGNDYRLEFLFLPEDEGITCMLYLYYPKSSAVNHLQEVTYVVESLEN